MTDLTDLMIKLTEEMEKVTQRVAFVEDEIEALPTSYVQHRLFQEQNALLHDKQDDMNALLGDVLGLPDLQVCDSERLGNRIERLEAELHRRTRKHIDLLNEIHTAMIEVKGQISDPIHKASALERLRQNVKADAEKLKAYKA